jgi:trimeric autotransporter adhesin
MKKKNRGLLNHKGVSICFALLLVLNYRASSQTVSYNKNDIPIGGVNNSAFGNNVLPTNSGSSNTAIGYSTLFSNTTGHNNTAVGVYALYSNTVGDRNIAIGHHSLYFNTNGRFNIAIGHHSLYNNTTGDYNCAIGDGALLSNTTGIYNTAVGNGALNNSNSLWNTGIGQFALTSNTSGYYNTGLGFLADVGSGSLTNATAIGFGAIVNNSNSIQLGNSSVTEIYAGTGINAKLITGKLQVTDGIIQPGYVLTSIDAVGNATWQQASGGNAWTLTGNTGTVDGTNFIGTLDNVPFNIRVKNTPSGRIDLIGNTFYGFVAGLNNNTNTGNTGIGNGALSSHNSGDNNTAVGSGCLTSFISGIANSFLGGDGFPFIMNDAHVNTGVGFEAKPVINSPLNTTALGAGAFVNDHNKVRIGDINVSVIEGQVPFSVSSDGRFKFNISEKDVKGLDFINRLRPVVYNFDTKKFQEFLVHNFSDSVVAYCIEGRDFETSTSIRHSGFIAQEVETATSETGYNFDGLHIPNSENDNYSLAYSQFVVPLVKSVQELSKQNNTLQKSLNEQHSIIETLKKEMEELRSMITNNPVEGKKGSIQISGECISAQLFQNAPNPFNKSTIIRYSIPSDARKAIIAINSLDGIKVSEFNLISKNGQNIEITGGRLSAGTYIYSLYVDDKLIDSKKMILTR